MTTPHQQIRRRTDGVIAIDFSRQQRLAQRATVRRSGTRLPANTLVAVPAALAVAGTLVVGSLAVAGMVHIVKAALSGAA